MKKNKNMSLESALDEERREVIALLEGRPQGAGARLRGASPTGVGKSPVRSMLDISIPAGVQPGVVASPRSATYSTVRSLLDTSSPPLTPSVSASQQTSASASTPNLSIEDAYQFDVPAKQSKKKRALAGVFGSSSSDYQRARHNSTSGTVGSRRPLSPSSRLGGPGRSMSPAQTAPRANPVSSPQTFVMASGKVIDMSSAYRRLSDANLRRSGGNLSRLPARKGSDPDKGESLAPDGGVRLDKDYYLDDDIEEDDDDDEALLDSDDDLEDYEAWKAERRRGRQRRRSDPVPDTNESEDATERRASNEETRRGAGQRYRSLLEPIVTITSPTGEKVPAKKAGIHPNTNYDDAASRASTPFDSDTEADMSDIRRAQKMGINISPIHSTPESHRCLRQILRGDYDDLQEEAEKGLRRQRMYLVATDLSDEAAYALEWTIGTVLRDGDTLLAVYAVDEDVGTGGEGVGIGEGAIMMNDTARTLQDISNEQKETQDQVGDALQPVPTPGSKIIGLGGIDPQPDWDSMEKSERERWHATMEVSDRCVKLLRRTRLQVRVVVEVFHCKSPKHMITEVIDYLEPTLVVLGSRGRSALKGVLLGSFSNYLVTKSSVPVMVARKRLRKHSKYKRDNLRLSNMLASPRGKLELAKID